MDMLGAPMSKSGVTLHDGSNVLTGAPPVGVGGDHAQVPGMQEMQGIHGMQGIRMHGMQVNGSNQ